MWIEVGRETGKTQAKWDALSLLEYHSRLSFNNKLVMDVPETLGALQGKGSTEWGREMRADRLG